MLNRIIQTILQPSYTDPNARGSYNNQNNGGSNENNGTNIEWRKLPINPPQSLPINNPASVNNDGTGNWGNQNNGLYGNCLDVLTGTVMGMGEAEEMPGSIDVVFCGGQWCIYFNDTKFCTK
ncbi:MAG: hypothetical protein V9E96_04980 [Chitinophagaceae bacterium]